MADDENSFLRAVRAALRKSADPDPKKVAGQLLPDLSPAERDEALRWLLPIGVRMEATKIRREQGILPVASASRYESAAELARSIFNARVQIDGKWHFVGDLDAPLCRTASEECEAAADNFERRAAGFSRLADTLEETGKKKLIDLGEDSVKGLLGA